MQSTITTDVVLKVVQCGSCGISFALPQTLWQTCYDEGGFFSSPLGHSRGWERGNKKSLVQELKERLAKEQENAVYWHKRKQDIELQKEAVERRLIAQKGQNTKLKRRVTNGVCPCCNRSFANVQRHMKTQHPSEIVGQ